MAQPHDGGQAASAENIKSFLEEHQRMREGRTSSSAVEYSYPGVPQGGYENNLILSEDGDSQSHDSESHLSSLGSGESHLVSVFDSSDCAFSVSTAPSRYGAEPAHRQRPTLLPLTESTTTSLPNQRLPCEFYWFTDCEMTFDLDDVAGWTQHVCSQHLDGKLPKSSICWFCDDFVFQTHPNTGERRRICYEARIHHIADHFRQGTTGREIRPDFDFLEHLRTHDLIDGKTFRIAIEFHEAPQPKGGINSVPFAKGRPRNLAVEVRSRPRGHRESRRSYQD